MKKEKNNGHSSLPIPAENGFHSNELVRNVNQGDTLPMLNGGLSQYDKNLLQGRMQALNKEPLKTELEKTFDGNAETVPISFVEMSLDELFFGQWSIENFRWQIAANEVIATIDLVVFDPVTGNKLTRSGAAAIQITVDSVPEEIKNDKVLKNRHALNLDNKKPNALYLSFPKLKSMCLKNAAQSLGKLFGRDLNRKKTDTLKPLMVQLDEVNFQKAIDRIKQGELGLKERVMNTFMLSDEQIKILMATEFESQKQIA